MVWRILAVLLAVGAYSYWLEGFGYDRGANEQKVENQKLIDAINQRLDDQKKESALKLARLVDEMIARTKKDELLREKIELERQSGRDRNAAVRRDNAGELRITVDPASVAGCRGGGDGPPGAGGAAPSAPATISVELPREIRENLRALIDEADDLAVDYRACYSWVTRDSALSTAAPEAKP